NDRFPEPIITPAVKAEEGHDEDISREDILSNNLVSEEIYLQMEDYTRKLFQRGTEMAAAQGLILVDTKYEFGLHEGRVVLMDEIHTPDSSRYFYLDGYEERQNKREAQQQLSKEFVRQWLIDQGFQGLEGQTMPLMNDAMVDNVSKRYIALYEQLTGQAFIPGAYSNIEERIQNAVDQYLLLP
ncbi:MAG: phosphoribosylaminoimidazolesuccinocarboxamide synthase, partial [Flavobacteriia bacterium]|nr:phosphoribosylaminoimidazolesuccinocarboxamide synthase [Flavobacteriia bacterium]